MAFIAFMSLYLSCGFQGKCRGMADMRPLPHPSAIRRLIYNCDSRIIIHPMQRITRHSSAIRKLLHPFATAKRSYYQILQVEPNSTLKQLRRSYIDKARKYHPDHNNDPAAVQEFKLLKEAYETLKDPQKKHMYDSGVSETPEDVAPVYNHDAKSGRKYYENKWYGYNRPQHTDTRDDYYQAKAEYFAQKPPNPWRHVVSFTFIVAALFGYDFFYNFQRAKEKERGDVIMVLQKAAPEEAQLTKRQKILRSYMEQRARQHKVD